ncbi:PREDICTED: phosphopantothenate--cysteine ligase-like [Chrysochloris asiatica]|uniref:Phosphopantothenate--cysteine ligase-like n=1 Tax=Chrysochloris asiatica TaxID=185453 RepID=A0A9B0WLA0_CHRAS|nr:PREDICTED: phosphopantothenate--cysteine ligase-like [Chrysochloris asiatica]
MGLNCEPVNSEVYLFVTPFAHRFPPQTWLSTLRPSSPARPGLLCLEAEEKELPGFAAALRSYQDVAVAGTFLAVEFTTLTEYLHLLQAAAQALNPLGSSAMFYLAAAMSDFYVPVSEMPEHKIQSSRGPLQITMKMVPKMLSPLVKDWAPKAFIISFKLETDPSIISSGIGNCEQEQGPEHSKDGKSKVIKEYSFITDYGFDTYDQKESPPNWEDKPQHCQRCNKESPDL